MVAGAFTVVAVLGLPFVWSDGPHRGLPGREVARPVARPVAQPVAAPGSAPAPAPLVAPTRHPRPRYLKRTYQAPRALVRAGAGGTLRIPSLGIRAPVDAVGLDGTAMAVPDDPNHVGWLTGSARIGDLVGRSVLAGHVSDAHDRPGALKRLAAISLGAAVLWSDAAGHRVQFRVVRIRLFPRARGLPAALFATDGPHQLNLVTCASRVTSPGGGFHYTANLVVTAVR